MKNNRADINEKTLKKWPFGIVLVAVLSLSFQLLVLLYNLIRIFGSRDWMQSLDIIDYLLLFLPALLQGITLLSFVMSSRTKSCKTVLAVWLYPAFLLIKSAFGVRGEALKNLGSYYLQNIVLILVLISFPVLYTLFMLNIVKKDEIIPIITISATLIVVASYFFRHIFFYTPFYFEFISFLIFGLMQSAYIGAMFSVLPKEYSADAPMKKPTQTVVAQKFCPSCGIQYTAAKYYCDQCGSALKDVVSVAALDSQTDRSNNLTTVDSQSAGFAVLGCFIPVVGLILFLIWKDKLPLRAKSTGKGALIGFITGIVMPFLMIYF